MSDRWAHVSQSPTRSDADQARALTADDLFGTTAPAASPLDERLRQAYFWLVNSAIISPFYDVQFSINGPLSYEVGDAGAQLQLGTDQSYSSNVLLPLLTFAVGGRCLLIGGPGRGKTTLAVLMGVLAGSASEEVRRHVVQGQPQLTVSDLIGTPLPRDLIEAESLNDVRIAWRSWLSQPVKIIDEYNRIPTKTQSALLTMVAEGYVESYDQSLSTAGDSGIDSWYFTANDDAGGGTFPVIQALRDRMDVTVSALGFNSRFLDELISRVEAGDRPEDNLPSELVFATEDRRTMAKQIRALPVPVAVRRRLSYFASHFEFAQHGGRTFEYRTKDTVATAGADVGEVIDRNSGADLEVDPGSQTTAGISVRALLVLVHYAKAMAWFRGEPEVTEADVAAVLPFVLRGKMLPNRSHPRFDGDADRELALDSVAWLGDLWTESVRQYQALGFEQKDGVRDLLEQSATGLDGVTAVETARRITAVESMIATIAGTGKLYGRSYDDLLALKYLHQRYSSYRRWLESSAR
ncbi:MAG: MoxR family ATPase [Pseudolysinimonas sp.]